MRIESHALDRELDRESKEAEARTTRSEGLERRRRRRRAAAAATTADEDDDERGVVIAEGPRRSCCWRIAACGGLEEGAVALARETAVTPTRMAARKEAEKGGKGRGEKQNVQGE